MPDLSASFFDHPLVRKIGLSHGPAAPLSLLRLALWAHDRYPDGHIREPDARIDTIAEWPREAGITFRQFLVHHCVAAHLDEGLRLLDWHDYFPQIRHAVAEPLANKPDRLAVPYQQIVDAYHEHCPDNPRVRTISASTKAAIKGRWVEDAERRNIGWWADYFKYVGQREFLTGRAGNRPFFADLMWLVGPKNMEKVINGRYQ